MSDKFGVVIVTYNPEMSLLNKTLKSIDNEAIIAVVNNGKNLELEQNNNIHVLNLNENKGIATAQNIGVKFLKKLNVEYVFFLDQDTNVPDNFFNKMLNYWKKLSDADTNIGAIGPNIFDRDIQKKRNIPYVIENGIRHSTLSRNAIRKDAMLISSGMLTKVDIFLNIGGNDEGFFIDWVDTDFILRLLQNGYATYAIGNVVLEHSVGKSSKRKFLWKTIYPTNHSPEREYYFYRNAILILKKNYKFAKKSIVHSLVSRFIYIFYEKQKIKELKFMIKGIKDGFLSKK